MSRACAAGRSVRDRLLNLARREGLQYQTLLTRYLQERLLYRLSISPFRRKFLLKGGALLYARHGFVARPTRDLDFMGDRIGNDETHIKEIVRRICSIPFERDGVTFSAESVRAERIAPGREYHGVRLTVSAAVDTVRQDVSLDIGFGDVITPSPVELDYPNLLEGFPAISVMAYSVESIVAEKFQTMIERASANSRMKDFYDVHSLLRREECDPVILEAAIRSTFRNRGTEYRDGHFLFTAAFPENPEFNSRWEAFMRKLRPKERLEFPEVALFIQQALKPYWERLKPVP